MNSGHLRKIKRQDRWATRLITVGGGAVILCVIAILALIAREAAPLFARAAAVAPNTFPLPPAIHASAAGLGMDEHRKWGFVLTRAGECVFFDLQDRRELDRLALPLSPGATSILHAEPSGDNVFTLLWDNGDVTLDQIAFPVSFDDAGRRSTGRTHARQAGFPGTNLPARTVMAFARRAESRVTCARVQEDHSLCVAQTVTKKRLLGKGAVESFAFPVPLPVPDRITAAALDSEGLRLVAGTAAGHLLIWDLSEPGAARLLDSATATENRRAITALCFVYGNESLAVADEGGRQEIWCLVPVSESGSKKRWRSIRPLTGSPNDPVTRIFASQRNKTLVQLSRGGVLASDHATSRRRLFTLSGAAPITLAAMSARGNGLITLDRGGALTAWSVRNPHPEAGLGALFGRVWYEGYARPEFVWQSSAATDDFEPKLSLVPLIFGTLKGTLCAMIFAVPLALFAALYCSQFTSPRVRGFIKPTVEIMAAIPSVVIGFLAALWLAPLVEKNLSSLFLSLAFLPTALLFAVLGWQLLRRWKPLRVVEAGFEFAALIPLLAVSVWLAARLGPGLETLLFGGDLKGWLFEEWNVRYDPRNGIIIAFALGFAVIPIIFTIAEDAFSNVPQSLTAASLALGASRWQTVWRVALPSASPGIFAGIVIGLGRAVGETMIVLMATGNTPIMDLSPFNGMRTLSANIAVEIPEAPLGGTLYRVLFLSGVALFAMTFVLNTTAELVRQRLRKKYGRF